IRAALDRIRDDLPEEAEPPGIWKFDPNNISIMSLAVESIRPLEELTLILERDISQRFEQIPGVGTIEIQGGINREIRVELKRDRLPASGLAPLDVQQAIARENASLPGGNVKEGIKDLYVRSLGEYTSVDEIANTVITYRYDARSGCGTWPMSLTATRSCAGSPSSTACQSCASPSISRAAPTRSPSPMPSSGRSTSSMPNATTCRST